MVHFCDDSMLVAPFLTRAAESGTRLDNKWGFTKIGHPNRDPQRVGSIDKKDNKVPLISESPKCHHKNKYCNPARDSKMCIFLDL